MRLDNVRVWGPAGLEPAAAVELDVEGGEDRDASGLILSPGWCDLHAHLRDPGFPEKETLETGAASAAFGGFTHVLGMANTRPVMDQPEHLRELMARAASLPIQVSMVGAVTLGLEGRSLTDAAGLKAAGAVAFSDDGRHAMDRDTLGRALAAAAAADLPLLVHAQVERRGTGPDAELAAIEEALEAVGSVPGARLHLQHVSTLGGVEAIRAAKNAGLAVTAEATPHHLALTAEDVAHLGPHGNVNPPLRSADDRDALRQGLLDGVIDAIATDHAPHDLAAKAAGASGFHGFETALPVVFGLGLAAEAVYRACVERPRAIVGQPLRNEWILIDPTAEWVVDPAAFKSRGKNTPFAGRRLRGRVVMTVCRGQLVMERVPQHA
jgi:dihydroorotase